MKKTILIFAAMILFALGMNAQTRKDGMPDMRYNVNKQAYSTPVYDYNSSSHLKKDGTPDRRYKENSTSSNSGASYNDYEESSNHSSRYIYSLERDNNGRIKRSESAKRQFLKETGYPKGREGYVVDHITPLKRGGCDCPSNMQWQTKADAKQKDTWE